jgi:hypothetical protein
MEHLLNHLLQLRVQDVRFATSVLSEDFLKLLPDCITDPLGVALHFVSVNMLIARYQFYSTFKVMAVTAFNYYNKTNSA